MLRPNKQCLEFFFYVIKYNLQYISLLRAFAPQPVLQAAQIYHESALCINNQLLNQAGTISFAREHPQLNPWYYVGVHCV